MLLLLCIISCTARPLPDTIEVYTPEIYSYNTVEEREFLTLLNNYRESVEANKVVSETYLTQLSKEHCEYTVEMGEISHIGIQSRRDNVFNKGGTLYGEIIGKGYSTVQTLFDAYLASELHRKVIDTKSYDHIGVTICKDESNKIYNMTIFVEFN